MGGGSALVPGFVAALAADSDLARRPDLEQLLQAFLEAGCAAWPSIAVDPEVFARFVGERSAAGLPPIGRASDLYLACACALGTVAAMKAFQARYRSAIAQAAATVDPGHAFADEVTQALETKLFVQTGDEALGIAQYQGRSSLRGWLVTAARRIALNLRRRKGDRPHDELGSAVAALQAEADPDVLLLKARYKTEVEASIRTALASLPAEDRALLLLQIRDGMTLPQLAKMRRVSRATVARRLASARASILDATRRDLERRLHLTASECESLLVLVRSQIELSLAAVAPPSVRS
jgi:RNA polymerase sigma-70 factor (ECF subfamily)